MVLLVAVSFVRLIDVLAERQGGVVTVNVIRAGRVSTIPPPIAPLRSPKFNYPSILLSNENFTYLSL